MTKPEIKARKYVWAFACSVSSRVIFDNDEDWDIDTYRAKQMECGELTEAIANAGYTASKDIESIFTCKSTCDYVRDCERALTITSQFLHDTMKAMPNEIYEKYRLRLCHIFCEEAFREFLIRILGIEWEYFDTHCKDEFEF